MEKIKISDVELNLKPDALILHDDEIITKMCNVYKLDLTEDQKEKHYLNYLRNHELFRLRPTSIESLRKTPYWEDVKNSDFYVFRLKEEFRKMLKATKSAWENSYGEYWFFFNKEEFTLLYNNCIDDELEPISDLSDLFEFIGEYIDYHTDYSDNNKLICDGGITQVRLIRNFNQLFE